MPKAERGPASLPPIRYTALATMAGDSVQESPAQLAMLERRGAASGSNQGPGAG